MPDRTVDSQVFASRLASGPAFLVLGTGVKPSKTSATSQYRWSGVYTTSSAGTVADDLRTDWRTTTSVGAMAASSSRSQTDLQVTYLFGGNHLPPGQKPPNGVLEEADAHSRAVQELARLTSETVTPRGVIVIDGWRPGDVLESRELVPLLRPLGPGQAHLFSATVWRDDPFVNSVVDAGQLVLHDEDLDTTLRALANSGAVQLGSEAVQVRSGGHVIAIDGGFVEIDIHTWNQIRRSARPVDIELLTPPVFSSPAARYQEFRAFAGAPDGSPRWRGIAAGMSVKRDYEAKLAETAADLLRERELPTPVVLAGQTATGKSVALASLAARLAQEGEFAVLHQSRRTARPSFDDIDMYAGWAEDHGARGTVLIWDGMVPVGDYEALARQLHNRGRKVLIIGSAYLPDGETKRLSNAQIIEAPADLSDREASDLRDLLQTFRVEVSTPRGVLDSSFLAFLYRALPETEHTLRHGLSYEMRAAERGMEALVRERQEEFTSETRITAMAAALAAAGISVTNQLMDESTDEKPLQEQAFNERSSIQRVTTLVLVAGRHGIPVPIDLALRVLGREASQSIRDALNRFDIVREVEDDSGEYFLTARSLLEAELLAQHEVPLEVEIEVVTEAIRNVRVTEGFASGPDEVQFIVSLIERVGPSSNNPKYRKYFWDIAEALRERREQSGRPHPRLVLQESAFVRGHVHWQQDRQQSTPQSRISFLEYNADMLQDVLADPNLRGMMRSSLTVELASTLGAMVHEVKMSDEGIESTDLSTRLDDILAAVTAARSIDPGNLYPIDVLAWSTRDAIQTGSLTAQDRLERLANAVATLESVEPNSVNKRQHAQLDMRLKQLNELLGKDDEVWERLESLEVNDDPAATYFLAKFEAETGLAGKKAALERLWSAPRATQHDWRCAQLLLDLTWESLVGTRLLQGERVPIHLSEATIQTLLRLSSTLRDADTPDRYKLVFVEGLAHFALGNYADSARAFREVERLTRHLARRIHTVLTLTDREQKPLVFTGRVESVHGTWGRARVEELATTVAFEQRLFSASQEFAPNQRLPAFAIGFKLTRGPVAEPRNLARPQRGR